jgi:hypothetical protein
VGKVIRPIIGVVAIIAILLALRQVQQKRFMASEVGPIDQKYTDAETEADFTQIKGLYEAVLPKTSGKDRQYVEGKIASCEAWLAFLKTSARPSIRKYEDCIAKMEKAQKLTGDPEGVWAKKLAEFRARHREAMGPDLAKMRADYEEFSKMGFQVALDKLETLYRWKQIWNEQDMYVQDKERNEVFEKVRLILLDGYSKMFEASIPKARAAKGSSEEALSTRAMPLGAVANVERFDKAKGEAYRKEYAADLAEARKASKELEKLMEKMMGAPR